MSTGLRATLITPPVEARSFATGMTAAASAPSSLAELANDAAGGHPAQRMTVGVVANDGVTFDRFVSTYYIASGAARFLRINVASESAYSAGLLTWLTVGLAIQDSAGNTVLASSSAIPRGLKNDVDFNAWFNGAAAPRFASGQRPVLWLDVAELIAAGLVAANAPWRFAWSISMHDAYSFLRGITVEERSQFLIDDSVGFGQVPSDYLPRGAVVDGTVTGLQRLWETVRGGLMANLRTYHSMCRPLDDAWLVTSTSLAPFGGDEESSGVAARYRVRPRKMRGTTPCPVSFVVRYKFTGGGAGDTAQVKLTTGGTSHTLSLTWADNTTWHDSTLATGATLDTTGAHDDLSWTAKVSNGASTLHVCARAVFDNPSP